MSSAIKSRFWAAADKLRANMDAAEYKHLVLGLIVLKFISDAFQSKRVDLTRRFADPGDEYHLSDADRLPGQRAHAVAINQATSP